MDSVNDMRRIGNDQRKKLYSAYLATLSTSTCERRELLLGSKLEVKS